MENETQFKALLDEQYEWPAQYIFKFIVPKSSVSVAKNLLETFIVSEKESKTGKYISLTATKVMEASEDILEVYKHMSHIDGVVSL